MNDNWEYKINGKKNSVVRILILFIFSVFLVVLTIDQFKGTQNKSLIVAVFFGTIAISSVFLFVKLLIRYFCFKVYIGKEGFYFQSNPFNGKYYKYTDIKSCKEELKTSRGNNSQPVYFYYFSFTENNGKTSKFQFEKALYEYELNILKERVEDYQ